MYQINWEACAEHITPEIFLKEYWQKKPLFIRGAISNSEGFFVVPIDADELARSCHGRRNSIAYCWPKCTKTMVC